MVDVYTYIYVYIHVHTSTIDMYTCMFMVETISQLGTCAASGIVLGGGLKGHCVVLDNKFTLRILIFTIVKSKFSHASREFAYLALTKITR